MSNGSASSLTVASPSFRRSIIERRVGSASAAKTVSSVGRAAGGVSAGLIAEGGWASYSSPYLDLRGLPDDWRERSRVDVVARRSELARLASIEVGLVGRSEEHT